MECKKALLFECINRNIFMDEYGVCTIGINGVSINDMSIDQVFMYNDESNMYDRITIDPSSFVEKLRGLFNKELATRKPQNNMGYYGYNRNSSFTEAEAKHIKLKSVRIYLHVNYWTSIQQGQTQNANEEVVLESEKDIEKYIAWTIDNLQNDSFVPVDFSNISEGDELYYAGHGKVSVSKVFSYPNKKNYVCEVTDSDGKYNIGFGSQDLCYLPYINRKTLLDEIDDAYDELLLSPYVMVSKECPGVYNVYWKPVKEASRYIVSVYKCIKNDKRNVYHLADFDIERNTFYLSLDNLIGSGFIFKVMAEDRNGKIIAKSRGANEGSPKYFNN